jgi:hypothetical protein
MKKKSFRTLFESGISFEAALIACRVSQKDAKEIFKVFKDFQVEITKQIKKMSPGGHQLTNETLWSEYQAKEATREREMANQALFAMEKERKKMRKQLQRQEDETRSAHRHIQTLTRQLGLQAARITMMQLSRDSDSERIRTLQAALAESNLSYTADDFHGYTDLARYERHKPDPSMAMITK